MRNKNVISDIHTSTIFFFLVDDRGVEKQKTTVISDTVCHTFYQFYEVIRYSRVIKSIAKRASYDRFDHAPPYLITS